MSCKFSLSSFPFILYHEKEEKRGKHEIKWKRVFAKSAPRKKKKEKQLKL